MDEDVILIDEHHYIRATSSRVDERTRVLKHGDTFGVFDRFGDVQPLGIGEQGLFHKGTRHLSRLELRIGGVRPLLLSSTVNEANDTLTADLTNPDLTGPDGVLLLPRGVLHLRRTKFIWRGVCHERVRLSNHGLGPVTITLSLRFEADFVDIFEVRGTRRARRGRTLEPQTGATRCTLGYRGLDDVVRRTFVELEPAPTRA